VIPRRSVFRLLLLASGATFVLILGLVLGFWFRPAASPLIPPASSSIAVMRPLPNVLVAVQDLARLESTSFHMERVIDLSDKQSHLFGLIQSEDAILLVAVASVTAGVDLAKLDKGDVEVDSQRRRARIRLPAAEIFHVELDSDRTYVHTRRTGILARRQEGLESRARKEAERALVDAAKEAGIFPRAEESARHVVEKLVQAMGYEAVEVSVASAKPGVVE
jgi:hypothetical protein